PQPDQRKSATKLLTLQDELEVSLGVPRDRILLRFPRSAVPQQHRAAAVLALRDDALEVAVRDRVILDVYGQALLPRVQAGALRDGPAQQHAVQLQPEVVVQAGRGVLLDQVGPRAVRARLRGGVAGRLARDPEV